MSSKKIILILLGSISISLFLFKSIFQPLSYDIHYPMQVNKLLTQINPKQMWNNIEILTKFTDRSADHDSGLSASLWLKSQLDLLVKNSNRSDASVYTIATNAEDINTNQIVSHQPSVILRIGTSAKPGIVLGAHIDTRTCDTDNCPLPGADDDGSGTSTLLEVARVLLTSDMQFKNPIYLVWYAAEEKGRIGSKSVVNEFKQKRIPVAAVMQFDMTGYEHNQDPTIWFDDSHTNKYLNKFAQKLVRVYIKQPTQMMHGQGGESDHWSWNDWGYKTVYPFESECHNRSECPRRQHTSADTMERLSLKHMTDYLKLGIAFAVELGEPVDRM